MKPKHVLESKRVFELLVKMNLHTIQNNRKLTKEFAYDIIPKITSTLIDAEKKNRKRKFISSIEDSGLLMSSLQELLTPTVDINNDTHIEVCASTKNKYTRAGSNKKKDLSNKKHSSVKICIDTIGTLRTLLFKSHDKSDNCCKDLFKLGYEKMMKDEVCEKRKTKNHRVVREMMGYDELYVELAQKRNALQICNAECYQKLACDFVLTPWRKNIQ